LHTVHDVEQDARATDGAEHAPTLGELAAPLEAGQRQEGPSVGLRERKKRARREALIDAAHRLVDERGLDAVTVEAICEEAGVSPRTFFNYFESKDDAVLGHTPWPVREDVRAVFAAGGPTGRLLDDLEILVGQGFEAPPMGQARLARAMELLSREPRLLTRHMAWIERYKDELTTTITQRLGDPPAHSPELVAGLVLLMVATTFQRWDAASGEGDAREHLSGVVDELRALLTV